MTWIKLDDKAPRHPKIAGLTDKAFRWWINALCYASEFLTDGILPAAFYKQVPKQVRAELTSAGLWDFDDPNLTIHDYLGHQSSKESVTQKRADVTARVTRYRERRNAVTNAGRNALVTPPDTENREQIQRSETTPSASQRGVGLIVSPAQFHKLQETHAFVGTNLRVPKVLHSELLAKSGANADVELRAWYAQLDADLEQSGKGTGDVFAWLRPRHQQFAVSKGWIDPAPKPQVVAKKPFSVAEAIAKREAEKSGKAS